MATFSLLIILVAASILYFSLLIYAIDKKNWKVILGLMVVSFLSGLFFIGSGILSLEYDRTDWALGFGRWNGVNTAIYILLGIIVALPGLLIIFTLIVAGLNKQVDKLIGLSQSGCQRIAKFIILTLFGFGAAAIALAMLVNQLDWISFYENFYGEVPNIQYSLDGHLIVACSENQPGKHDFIGVCNIWDAKSGKLIRSSRGQRNFVSLPGNVIISGTTYGPLTISDFTGSTRDHPDLVIDLGSRSKYGIVNKAQISPNGQWLCVSNGEFIRLWNLQSRQEVQKIVSSNLEKLKLYGFSPDSMRLLFQREHYQLGKGVHGRTYPMYTGRELSLWNIPGASEIRLFSEMENHDIASPIDFFKFNAAGKILFTQKGFGQTGRLWNTDSGSLLQTLPNQSGPIDFSSNSRFVTAQTDTKDKGSLIRATLMIKDIATGKSICSYLCPYDWRWTNPVAFGHENNIAAVGNFADKVFIWDLNTGKESANFAVSCVTQLLFSPDDIVLIARDNTNTIQFFQMPSHKLLKTLKIHTQLYLKKDAALKEDILFSTKYIAVREGNRLHILDSNTLKEEALISHRNYIRSVAFSPDGAQVTTASYDDIKVSDLGSGKTILTLNSHPYSWDRFFDLNTK